MGLHLFRNLSPVCKQVPFSLKWILNDQELRISVFWYQREVIVALSSFWSSCLELLKHGWWFLGRTHSCLVRVGSVNFFWGTASLEHLLTEYLWYSSVWRNHYVTFGGTDYVRDNNIVNWIIEITFVENQNHDLACYRFYREMAEEGS